MVDDARYRTRVYLTTYYTAGNVLKDDDVTPATVINCYANANYPLRLVFDTKAVDGIYTIGTPDSTPKLTNTGYIYAYEENVPIEIYTIDKTGITGTILRWRMEAELRLIVETYPYGSYRALTRMSENEKDMGGWKLYSVRYILSYTRAKDDYAPTAPSSSYGDDFIWEGDVLSGGVGGTWDITNHLGDPADTIVVNSDRNTVITTTTAADTYIHNEADHLASDTTMSSTIYTKIRWRYKTTGNTKAKIIVAWTDGGGGTQTVLSETASLTWTSGSATITTGHTLSEVRLYACDAAGTVTYDFIEIFKGTYVFPNVTNLESNYSLNDALIPVPSRQGEYTQALGSKLREIRMTCDLRMEPDALTWKRPQATTPKTDYNNDDVIKELWHYLGDTHLWHWLDLGDPTDQFKARLADLKITSSGETHQAELLWREYRHGGEETVTERFGLSL